MLANLFQSPDDILVNLGNRAKAARLKENLSRETLAIKSGVAHASIKRFETTGLIGTAAMLRIAFALGMDEHFNVLFEPKPFQSIEEVGLAKRKRGRQ